MISKKVFNALKTGDRVKLIASSFEPKFHGTFHYRYTNGMHKHEGKIVTIENTNSSLNVFSFKESHNQDYRYPYTIISKVVSEQQYSVGEEQQYSVGDMVRIAKKLSRPDGFKYPNITPSMRRFAKDQEYPVTQVHKTSYNQYRYQVNDYWWLSEWLVPVTQKSKAKKKVTVPKFGIGDILYPKSSLKGQFSDDRFSFTSEMAKIPRVRIKRISAQQSGKIEYICDGDFHWDEEWLTATPPSDENYRDRLFSVNGFLLRHGDFITFQSPYSGEMIEGKISFEKFDRSKVVVLANDRFFGIAGSELFGYRYGWTAGERTSIWESIRPGKLPAFKGHPSAAEKSKASADTVADPKKVKKAADHSLILSAGPDLLPICVTDR